MTTLFRKFAFLFAASATFQLAGENVVQTRGLQEYPGPIRVLILSGGTHDWRRSASFLRQILSDSGRFEVRVSEAVSGLTAQTLASFDVVVDDYDGLPFGSSTEKALDTFVASGKGLVVTRAGLISVAERRRSSKTAWPGLTRLTKISPSSQAPNSAESQFRLLHLKPAQTAHPIMRNCPAELPTGDQPLNGFLPQPGAEVLACSEKGEPLLLVSNYGQGRVFCTALGHNPGAMQEAAYVATFLRGTEWAASTKVTLAWENSIIGRGGVRVLVLTGGHEHEAGFYSLFDGCKDLGRVPVSESKQAFQQDLRTKYDVLVFYDFTRELDESGKKNLHDFVESGKGVVVLHHGILNFQKWPWWYEEVVGGLYRLERQGNVPNSTVKPGEQHWITAAGQHPITDGITPFHVTDETYKGLFISTNIHPLLLTDNPTSDRTVAWIGPCKTSKVVFIQLGHDHSPFSHPSYRKLVHNAILWTADKLK